MVYASHSLMKIAFSLCSCLARTRVAPQVVEAVSVWFWSVHGRTALPPVRQLMEVFAVRMCTAYPDLFATAVMKVGGWAGGRLLR